MKDRRKGLTCEADYDTGRRIKLKRTSEKKDVKTSLPLLMVTLLLCCSSVLWLKESAYTPLDVSSELAMQALSAELLGNMDALLPDPLPIEERQDTETAGDNTPEEVQTMEVDGQVPYALRESSPYTVSAEAQEGTWIPVGTNWMFLSDGVAYVGWLNDTDGKRYYFDLDGIMQTGWLDEGGARYYLDADGIMQTGQVQIDGESFTFGADGRLIVADASVQEPAQTAGTEGESSGEEQSQTGEEKTASTKAAAEEQEMVASAEPGSRGFLALTFDDGPDAFTQRLVTCLQENDSRGTFFLVGQEMENFPELARIIQEAGCELGNHSYSHVDLTELTSEELQEELGKTDELIYQMTGIYPALVRPPYGTINDAVRQTAGRPLILWSVDTDDWETQEPDLIARSLIGQAQDGQIILLHDIFSETVDAVELAVPELIRRGYLLVTVSELAEKKGISLEAGQDYSYFGEGEPG